MWNVEGGMWNCGRGFTVRISLRFVRKEQQMKKEHPSISIGEKTESLFGPAESGK